MRGRKVPAADGEDDFEGGVGRLHSIDFGVERVILWLRLRERKRAWIEVGKRVINDIEASSNWRKLIRSVRSVRGDVVLSPVRKVRHEDARGGCGSIDHLDFCRGGRGGSEWL